MNSLDLLKIIEKKDIVIYGTGYVSENFYTMLKIQKLAHKVKCFVVSDSTKICKNIYNVPVKVFEEEIDEIKRSDIYVCIAVHESIKSEIEKYLLKYNINNYVWVYPYIFELVLGIPIINHIEIETKKIIFQQKYDSYAFAVRYLAIDNYYGQNEKGYELYLKALYLQCEKKTAYKRLDNFIQLIKSWEKNGYQDNYTIKIDEKYRLIDGTHRLTLACYYGMERIYCDVFPCSDNYNKIMKVSHLLSMEILQKNGFELSEIEMIKKVQNKIWGINYGN